MYIKDIELFPGSFLHLYVVRIIIMNLICNYCQSSNSEPSQRTEGKKYSGISLGFHWREKFCSYLPGVNYRAFSCAPHPPTPPPFLLSPLTPIAISTLSC